MCVLTGSLAVPASAQPTATSTPAPAASLVTDAADRTGTNPANLRDTVEVSNAFRSHGDGLFDDQVTWSYAQALAGNRLRARVELPLTVANVTGRTEAGFGDLALGVEWAALVRGRTAWLAGVDVAFDTSTNVALSTGQHVIAPSVGVAFAPRLTTVVSARYRHRVSVESVDDMPDVSDGTLEAAVVQRFGNGTWLRALPAVVLDYELDESHASLDGEWGRVLTGGMSTWVRAGRVFGSASSRRYDWSLVVGFRFVG